MNREIAMVMVLIWLAVPVTAEYYQYKDRNGITVFTDNLGDIPKEERPLVNRFKSETSREKDQEPSQEGKDSVPETNEGLDSTGEGFAGGLKWLKEEKQALDLIYEDLLKRRTALRKKEAAGLKSGPESIAHQKKADALNADIEAFDTRKKVYEDRVRQFDKTHR